MPDIDTQDMNDHLECAEYASDIFTFFRRMEPTIQVDCEYMNRQRYITRQMRAVLIDWIVDVHAKFKVSGTPILGTPIVFHIACHQ